MKNIVMKNIVMRKVILVLCLALFPFCAHSNQPDCDRRCVLEVVDQYVAALVAHDPAALTFADAVRYTENGKDVEIGNGIWQTITGQGAYRQTFVDDGLQSVVFFGVFEEGDDPLLLATRLRFDGHHIAEIENLVSRYDQRNRLISRHQLTESNPVYESVQPVVERLSRAELIAASDAYFDGIANSLDDGVPMHRECNRRENGVLLLVNKNPETEPCSLGFHRFNYITDVRDRRVAVVDTARGLVLIWAFFDVPGDVEVEPRSYGPSDLAPSDLPSGANSTSSPLTPPPVDSRKIPRSLYIAELFRLEDGKIRDIEAIMFNLDLGAKSGW
mgnify:CR=1 FL=1